MQTQYSLTSKGTVDSAESRNLVLSFMRKTSILYLQIGGAPTEFAWHPVINSFIFLLNHHTFGWDCPFSSLCWLLPRSSIVTRAMHGRIKECKWKLDYMLELYVVYDLWYFWIPIVWRLHFNILYHELKFM